jgi:type III secretory pathway component EscT
VQSRTWQITLRWMMIRIVVIAAALAFLVAAARQSQKYHCGHPVTDAVAILVVLALGNPLARAIVRAYSIDGS